MKIDKTVSPDFVRVEMTLEEYNAFAELMKLLEKERIRREGQDKNISTPLQDEDYKDLILSDEDMTSYILKVKSRLLILQLLRNQKLTSREISEITGLNIDNVREKLKDLRRKDLIVHNKDSRKRRIHCLTEYGYKILYKAEEHIINHDIKLTQKMDDETKILLTYIDLSKYRKIIFYTFHNFDMLTAKEISEITKININTVNKTLEQLKEKDLLIILNEHVIPKRKYKLTEKGHQIIKYLK